MPRLLIATNNEGKLADFRRLLDGCGWELVSPAELGLTLPDDEPGETYAENARIKALNGARASGLVALAEDSGLEIDALGGGPGVRSARYLGEDASYQERFARILGEMAALPEEKRGARFRCVIAIAAPGGDEVKLCEGEVEGLIAGEPRGDRGFGYAPIFLVPELGQTVGEMDPQVKDGISHRGRAAARARAVLRGMLDDQRISS
jgi:XTP/dITP diphosphohydrolase